MDQDNQNQSIDPTNNQSLSESGDGTKKLILTALVLLVLGGVLAYYFLFTDNGNMIIFGGKVKTKQFQYSDAYNNAKSLHSSGDINSAIPALQTVASQSSEAYERARAKLILAYDLYTRNEGDDRLNSVKLYAEVILDENVPGYVKSGAISDLMGHQYYGTNDIEYFKNVILSVEPFASIGRESKNLVFAERKMLEFGESFAPNAMLEFRIAQWYGNVLQGSKLTPDVVKDYTNKLRSWTIKAEGNIADLLPNIEESQKIYLYQLNGMSRRQLGDLPEAEAAFMKAMSILNNGDNTKNIFIYEIGLFLRFNYAATLAEDSYKESRNEDIKKILEPMVNTPEEFRDKKFGFFTGFLKQESSGGHDNHRHYKDIKKLMVIYPEFAKKVASFGFVFK